MRDSIRKIESETLYPTKMEVAGPIRNLLMDILHRTKMEVQDPIRKLFGKASTLQKWKLRAQLETC